MSGKHQKEPGHQTRDTASPVDNVRSPGHRAGGAVTDAAAVSRRPGAVWPRRGRASACDHRHARSPRRRRAQHPPARRQPGSGYQLRGGRPASRGRRTARERSSGRSPCRSTRATSPTPGQTANGRSTTRHHDAPASTDSQTARPPTPRRLADCISSQTQAGAPTSGSPATAASLRKPVGGPKARSAPTPTPPHDRSIR